jgi:hypothetical protein
MHPIRKKTSENRKSGKGNTLITLAAYCYNIVP